MQHHRQIAALLSRAVVAQNKLKFVFWGRKNLSSLHLPFGMICSAVNSNARRRRRRSFKFCHPNAYIELRCCLLLSCRRIHVPQMQSKGSSDFHSGFTTGRLLNTISAVRERIRREHSHTHSRWMPSTQMVSFAHEELHFLVLIF